MARPRVFVSSTYYDLKHVRSSLEVFIESLGFDAILFEKGDIAFHPDHALDESCYREAKSADIFVLIIGGRYGSAASSETDVDDEPPQRYDSITKKEFNAAQDADVPTFILVDAQVHSEYSTYRKNRANTSIIYAHVDNPAIFQLIDWIYSKKNNNPVHTFDRATDIAGWLREQWAGLFRELLHKQSQQQQLSNLNAQVSQLASLNGTFKTYLEAVLSSVSPEGSQRIITDERQRLVEDQIIASFAENPMFSTFEPHELHPGAMRQLIADASTWTKLSKGIRGVVDQEHSDKFISWLKEFRAARRDFNKLRTILGLSTITWPASWNDCIDDD